MSQTLPPKTCTIDRMITVKEDVEKVLSGQKRSTRRNGRYADIGEVVELEGKKYEVTSVYSQALGDMSDEDAQSEGYANMEEYKNYILSMHEGMPWVPTMRVWVHEFKEV